RTAPWPHRAGSFSPEIVPQRRSTPIGIWGPAQKRASAYGGHGGGRGGQGCRRGGRHRLVVPDEPGRLPRGAVGLEVVGPPKRDGLIEQRNLDAEGTGGAGRQARPVDDAVAAPQEIRIALRVPLH